MGIGVPLAAIALGASVIEKHFTLSRDDGGVDSVFSLEPQEFSALAVESMRAWQSLGSIFYGPTESEQKSRIFRRSIFVAQDILAGEKFSEKNIRIVRPGNGAPPSLYEKILGKVAATDLKKGTPLTLDLLVGG